MSPHSRDSWYSVAGRNKGKMWPPEEQTTIQYRLPVREGYETMQWQVCNKYWCTLHIDGGGSVVARQRVASVMQLVSACLPWHTGNRQARSSHVLLVFSPRIRAKLLKVKLYCIWLLISLYIYRYITVDVGLLNKSYYSTIWNGR